MIIIIIIHILMMKCMRFLFLERKNSLFQQYSDVFTLLCHILLVYNETTVTVQREN